MSTEIIALVNGRLTLFCAILLLHSCGRAVHSKGL